jgi:hypothetical protein
MITVLFSVAVLGICFALIALRLLVKKDSTPRGPCGRSFEADRKECAICPSASKCEEPGGIAQEPKSSNAMFSLGTPSSSNIRKQACNIGGGPQR